MFFSALEINELFPVSIERSVSLTQKIKGGGGKMSNIPCSMPSVSSRWASKFDLGLVWVFPGQLHHCHIIAKLPRALRLPLPCLEEGISP